MSRTHIEFIQQQDQPWIRNQLTPGLPPLEYKLLSRDSDNGAFTALVRLESDWHLPVPVAYDTDVELFVIEGRMSVACNDDTYQLSPGGYLRIGRAVTWHDLQIHGKTKLMFMAAKKMLPTTFEKQSTGQTTYVDTEKMAWEIPWVTGPEPGLRIKLLYMDDTSGAYSRLIAADPGWTETRQEHHDCVEEVYMLSGDMTMGRLGTMTTGGYIWRPPMIKHGPMQTDEGGVMFIRTDGPLVNHYTNV